MFNLEYTDRDIKKDLKKGKLLFEKNRCKELRKIFRKRERDRERQRERETERKRDIERES